MQERKLELSLDRLSFSFLLVPHALIIHKLSTERNVPLFIGACCCLAAPTGAGGAHARAQARAVAGPSLFFFSFSSACIHNVPFYTGARPSLAAPARTGGAHARAQARISDLDRLSFSFLLVPHALIIHKLSTERNVPLLIGARGVVSRRQREQEEHMQEPHSSRTQPSLFVVFFVCDLLYIYKQTYTLSSVSLVFIHRGVLLSRGASWSRRSTCKSASSSCRWTSG